MTGKPVSNDELSLASFYSLFSLILWACVAMAIRCLAKVVHARVITFTSKVRIKANELARIEAQMEVPEASSANCTASGP